MGEAHEISIEKREVNHKTVLSMSERVRKKESATMGNMDIDDQAAFNGALTSGVNSPLLFKAIHRNELGQIFSGDSHERTLKVVGNNTASSYAVGRKNQQPSTFGLSIESTNVIWGAGMEDNNHGNLDKPKVGDVKGMDGNESLTTGLGGEIIDPRERDRNLGGKVRSWNEDLDIRRYGND